MRQQLHRRAHPPQRPFPKRVVVERPAAQRAAQDARDAPDRQQEILMRLEQAVDHRPRPGSGRKR
jgi:hypothetical protein